MPAERDARARFAQRSDPRPTVGGKAILGPPRLESSWSDLAALVALERGVLLVADLLVHSFVKGRRMLRTSTLVVVGLARFSCFF